MKRPLLWITALTGRVGELVENSVEGVDGAPHRRSRRVPRSRQAPFDSPRATTSGRRRVRAQAATYPRRICPLHPHHVVGGSTIPYPLRTPPEPRNAICGEVLGRLISSTTPFMATSAPVEPPRHRPAEQAFQGSRRPKHRDVEVMTPFSPPPAPRNGPRTHARRQLVDHLVKDYRYGQQGLHERDRRWGRAIASTGPGNPAPVPMSQTVTSCGIASPRTARVPEGDDPRGGAPAGPIRPRTRAVGRQPLA